MFTERPTYNPYRPLRLLEPMLRGEDVYALQKALGVDADGGFGRQTDEALQAFQEAKQLTVDGVAGPRTQSKIVAGFTNPLRRKLGIPSGLLNGQLTFESQKLLGNYSQLHSDGSFDAGVAQCNSHVFDLHTAFDPQAAIEALADRVKEYHSYFAGLGEERRWGLAAGAWNAPAFAAYIAREEGSSCPARYASRFAPSAQARATLEEYIVHATALMRL